jgi:Zn finger protein HypA/HybF involved in hydrogenase expression
MDDTYFSKDDVTKTLIEFFRCSHISETFIKAVVDEIPATDVRPVVRGTWIKYAPYNSDMMACSECEKYWILDGDQYDYHFCPNCGADMRQLDKLFIAARGISKSRTVLRATMKAMGWSDAEIAEIERQAERNVKGESNDG